MSRIGVATMALVVVVGGAVGQQLPEPVHLQQAMDDIHYAELLTAAELTPEQLDELLRIQAALETEAVVAGDLAGALTKVLAAVLMGVSMQQAQEALGQQQQLIQQAQQRMQQSLQRSKEELQNSLTDEQKGALVWLNSPGHALDGVVDAVAGARTAEDAQWNQFRTQASQAISQMTSQAGQEGGTPAEEIVGLLDQVRAMDDATFQAKQASLAQEWLPTLLPNVAQMLQNPQFRQQQLAQACERLITYERGNLLAQAKRDATATQ